MKVSFHVNRDEFDAIKAIVDRAMKMPYPPSDRMTLHMDITACHANGRPLDLQRLLAADDTNFAHDVYGISRHIDRETGQLTDCFLPRFALPAPPQSEES